MFCNTDPLTPTLSRMRARGKQHLKCIRVTLEYKPHNVILSESKDLHSQW